MAGDDRVRAGPARPLFTVAEAAAWTGARVAGPGEEVGSRAVITGVEVDSRFVRSGDLFGALPGERVDGHAFLDQAFAAGAGAALVSRPPDLPVPPGRFHLLVADVLAALTELARRHRDRFSLPVIGVTGSVGKTTTKDLIAAALGGPGRVLASRGNLNTDVGLPLTIFELGPEHEVACLEMGMRGPGEIARLAGLARPSVGVITNVGPVHIEALGTMEAIARAKEELLWALPPEGSAVLNADDPVVLDLAGRHRGRLARVLTYGMERPADLGAVKLEADAAGETSFTVWVSGEAARLIESGSRAELGRFTVPLGGRPAVSNALAAVACGLIFGRRPDEIGAGLARPRLSAMRQEVVDVGGVRVINDAYNAGPASMRASVELLRATRARRGGRAIAVLGDMLELGELSESAHCELGSVVAAAGLDFLVAVGPRGAILAGAAVRGGLVAERVRHFETNLEAAWAVLELARPGDTVLVKASRGMRFEEVVERLVAGLGTPGKGGAVG